MKLGKLETNKIHHGNCIELMKNLPAGSIDHILTDPPFAIEFKAKQLSYNRKLGNVLKGYGEISQDKYLDFSLSWMREAFRVLKETGSMFVFSGWTNLKDILIALDELGFTTVNHLIWKYQFGVFTKKKFVTSHYHILFVVKDKKSYKFNKIDHYPEDVLTVNREYWKGKKKTPTKLPLELVDKLVQYTTDPGDIVLDPFMGSGTTAVACKQLNRHWLGFELVEDYITLANQRLE
ncbi:MAG: site-specific DNA-methyltransferase [Candidatus Altiarchaeota archaeon]|nr:site-specific DNA-methyltransferase [Candidatus Altiarchaeota archaeon]